MELTERQISLVQSNFHKLVPIAGTFAELFYTRLFALDPKLGEAFEKARDPHRFADNWHDMGRDLMNLMCALVSHLHKVSDLAPVISALGRLRLAPHLDLEDYDCAGQAFIWTLARCLEDDFTDEAKLAWLDSYSLLAGIMQRAVKEMSGGKTGGKTAAQSGHASGWPVNLALA